jgi:hypothetical protein
LSDYCDKHRPTPAKGAVDDALHAVFTRHGIASRSDYPQALIGDLIQWAADECRHTLARKPASREAVRVLEELQRWTKTVLEEPCGTRWDWLEERITIILADLRTEGDDAE